MFGDNGAEIIFDATRKKWAIYDVHGMLHGWRRSKDEATELAEPLPGPGLLSCGGPDQRAGGGRPKGVR